MNFRIICLIFSLLFFEYEIYKSITITDVILFALIIHSAINFRGYYFSGYKYLLLFLFLLIISLIFVSDNLFFNLSSYINNSLRLIAYSFGCFFIPPSLTSNSNLKSISSAISFTLVFISIVTFTEFITNAIGLSFNIDFFVREGKYISSLRQSSVFKEPAHLSIFISTLLSVNLIINNKFSISGRLFVISTLLCIISLLLSLSLSGYLLGGILVSYIFLNLKSFPFLRRFDFIFRFIFAIFLLFGLVFVIQLIDPDSTLISRVLNLNILNVDAQSADGSAQARILGSFYYTIQALKENYFLGIGFGQLTPYFASISDLPQFYFRSLQGGVNNIFAAITIQFGISGLVIFVLFVTKIFREKLILLIFLATCFSWGFFNISIFWIFIYLSIVFNLRTQIINNSK